MELIGKAPGPSRSSRTGVIFVVVAVLGAVAAFGVSKLLVGGAQEAASREIPSVLDRERKIVEVRAQNRLAQNSARNAMAALEVYFIDYGGFQDLEASTLEEIEPALDYTTGASTSPEEVSFRTTQPGVMIAVYNGAGRCYALGHRPGRKYGYADRKVSSADECSAHAFTPTGLRARW